MKNVPRTILQTHLTNSTIAASKAFITVPATTTDVWALFTEHSILSIDSRAQSSAAARSGTQLEVEERTAR